jgi:hypothetical protein
LDQHVGNLVVLTRLPLPFRRASEIEESIRELSTALPASRRAGRSIVIDMRAAPIRVEPSLDPAFARFREETERGFARVVVVVATPLGRVRSERLRALAEIPIVNTLDEAFELLRRGDATR